MHFFIEHTALSSTAPTSANSFGPQSSDIFRITTKFAVTGNPKAFACMTGQMVVQNDATTATKVNVFLKPLFPLSVPSLNPVKYFVYRGLDKSSFLSGTNIIPDNQTANSSFINKLWTNHDLFKTNSGNPTAPDPSPEVFGYDTSLADSVLIDRIFAGEEGNVKAYEVLEGMWLGNFLTGTIGFEIVQEEGLGYNLNLGDAREDDFTLSVAGITDAFDKKIARENILNFIDPAALFGRHIITTGVKATTYSGSTPTTTIKQGDVLYNELINKFGTKNRIYLDIRNDIGYSLNFYENYDDGSGNNIKLGLNGAATVARPYQEMDWPLVFIDSPAGTGITFSFRINDNKDPLAYVQSNFLDLVDTAPWTSDIILTPILSGGDNVATLYKIHYLRQRTTDPIPNTVLKTEKYTDNIFGPIQSISQNQYRFNFVHNDDLRFIEGTLPGGTKKFGFAAERGVTFDFDSVIFFSRNFNSYDSTGEFFYRF